MVTLYGHIVQIKKMAFSPIICDNNLVIPTSVLHFCYLLTEIDFLLLAQMRMGNACSFLFMLFSVFPIK